LKILKGSCIHRTAKFYLLPKIHKGINPPPGRPIVSANGCPIERISQLVDPFLNPISKTHQSYIKDTTHFLQILQEVGPLPNNSILVTVDVTSLYLQTYPWKKDSKLKKSLGSTQTWECPTQKQTSDQFVGICPK
jgi:hypothetical protein